MKKTEANKLKKELEKTGWFDIVITHSINENQWNLRVREISQGDINRLSTSLCRYYYINAFCVINQIGMLIECSYNVPNYYIY